MCRFLEGEERAIGYFHPAEPSNKPLEWTGHTPTSLLRDPQLPACHSGAALGITKSQPHHERCGPGLTV
jgi:hypothetical protein